MIRNTVERLDRWITWGSLITTTMLMLLTSIDALGRYLFDHPIEGAFQISEDYLLVLGVFLALGYSYREGSHVRVTFLVDKLKGEAKLACAYAVQVFSLLCAAALAFATGSQAVDLLRTGARANGLISYALWPAHFCVFLGCLMLTLLIFLDFPRVKTGESALQSSPVESGETEVV